MNNTDFSIAARQVVKTFIDGMGQKVQVLSGVDLAVPKGALAAVIGASGSGKSTLLQILGGLDACDSGSVTVAGKELGKLSESDLDDLRNRHLGFVYQFHHLLPEFTALENVAMPLLIRRMPKAQALLKAKEVLTAVGLEHRLEHLPSQLSGGERQRAAIARAMVTDPDCILADEPTGNLDRETADDVFSRFVELSKSRGTSVLIVTHDLELANRCDIVFRLVSGRVELTQTESH